MDYNFDYLVFTCIEEELKIVEKFIEELLANLACYPEKWKKNESSSINLKEIYYPAPLSGGSHLMKFALWEPMNKKGSTIFFVNYEDGWNSIIELLAKKFNVECYHFGISNTNIKYPMYKFSYFKNDKKRVLLLYKDFKKWEFFSSGEALNFEKVENYKKRLKKDRLNKEILFSYTNSIGCNIKDDKFWNSDKDVILYERTIW